MRVYASAIPVVIDCSGPLAYEDVAYIVVRQVDMRHKRANNVNGTFAEQLVTRDQLVTIHGCETCKSIEPYLRSKESPSALEWPHLGFLGPFDASLAAALLELDGCSPCTPS